MSHKTASSLTPDEASAASEPFGLALFYQGPGSEEVGQRPGRDMDALPAGAMSGVGADAVGDLAPAAETPEL